MYKFNKEEHIHTFEGKPLIGTSSVMDILSKPLTWWASGLACNTLGWIKPLDTRKKNTPEELEKNDKERIESAIKFLELYKEMTPQEYCKLLDKAYRAHSSTLDKSAKKGTDLHKELEDFVKGKMGIIPVREYDEKITPFIKWSNENVKTFLFSEAHCYSITLWTGGIIDCGVELMNGEYAIIDFKSSKDAYKSQFYQIGGYDLQITENGIFSPNGKLSKKLDRAITKHIVVPFGKVDATPVISGDTEGNKEGFLACLVLYKKENNNN
jgi:hypothetical protein